MTIPYVDPEHDVSFFDAIVTWIGMRSSGWNFRIDSGGRMVDRNLHVSFDDHLVAVEFKLIYS